VNRRATRLLASPHGSTLLHSWALPRCDAQQHKRPTSLYSTYIGLTRFWPVGLKSTHASILAEDRYFAVYYRSVTSGSERVDDLLRFHRSKMWIAS